MLTRPAPTEYAEFYKSYIARVPEGPVLDFLAKQLAEYKRLLAKVSDEAATAAPAPGKWSIKQVLGHLCDTERVQAYRALRFARGDASELRGFEQDDYVREAHSNSRSVDDLLTELESIRKASIALFGSLPPQAEKRSGIANGNAVTVRAMAYITAGHAQHHLEGLKAGLAQRAGAAR